MKEKKLVVFPSDPMSAYIEKGQTYEYYREYFNPGGYFDKVYCISPWKSEVDKVGELEFICARPTRFHSIIKKLKPDVVRAYGGYHCSDWACISKVKNIPVLVSVHDTDPNLIHHSLIYADHIICMSTAVKEAVHKKLNIPYEKMTVMPNRVDLDVFRHQVNEVWMHKLDAMYGKGKNILHIGRKQEQKNLDTVIKSLQYLPQEYKVLCIGQGDDREYVELAKKSGVFERCIFIPSVKRDELPYYYSWCDCMCTPSRWEGFGMVFMEAAACECAIITSNIGPMNEYLENEKNAILVDEYENPEIIAKAIEKACEDTEFIAQMRKEARKVGEMFEKEAIDKREKEIYKMVIERGSVTKKVTNIKLIWREFFRKYT